MCHIRSTADTPKTHLARKAMPCADQEDASSEHLLRASGFMVHDLGFRVKSVGLGVGGFGMHHSLPHVSTPPHGAAPLQLRFRGGLVFKAHRLVYHSTLGLSVIKKKKNWGLGFGFWV